MRRIAKRRTPIYRSKRGGSSGGGGSSAGNTDTSSKAPVFRAATLAEIDSNIGAWEKEIKEMDEAAAGILNNKYSVNKYSSVDMDTLDDSMWIADTVRRSTVENRIGIKDSFGNIQAAAISQRK